MDISVVIPAYNEEKNVVLLYHKLKEVLDGLGKKYEIIFVDDGSRDRTFENLVRLHEKDKKVKVIQFQGNFGKAAALSAGWKKTEGRIIIQMDADLQDDPREIPRFLSRLEKDNDLVSGWKYQRKDSFFGRIIFSRVYNFLVNLISGTKIHDQNCGFKAYKKELVKNINIYGELHRYIPALAKEKGFRIGEIKVRHHKRKYGKSRYGWGRLFRGFFDLITVKYLTTYNKRPLHLFGFFGLFFFFVGFLGGLFLVYLKFLGKSISDRPLLFLVVLLLFLGVQFLSLGLIAEMITNQSSKQSYVIKKVWK